jgi:ABC-type glycerol-3-phosphate transport system substrate-binding protein
VAPWLRSSKLDLNDLTVLPSSIKHANVTYGLPFQATVDGFVYNKTLFQREGVPLPTEAWTWDNVIDAAKRLTDVSARRWGIGSVAPHWAHWGWVVESAGGKFISDDGKKTLLNTPLVIEAFQHRVDLILKHQVAPPLSVTGLSFQAGNLAMNLNRTPKALIPLVGSQFEWDVMYIPKWHKSGKRVVRQDDQANWLTDAAKKR